MGGPGSIVFCSQFFVRTIPILTSFWQLGIQQRLRTNVQIYPRFSNFWVLFFFFFRNLETRTRKRGNG